MAWLRPGEGDVEDLSAVPCRLGPDPPAQNLDQVLGDGEPKAEAAGLAGPGAVDLVEALEDAAPVLGRDARAAVTHADHDLAFGERGLDVDGGARRRELGGVVEQVAKRLSELGPVRLQDEARRDGGVDGPLDAEPRQSVVDQL